MSNPVKPWKLKRTRQCKACPWRTEAALEDIPAYSAEKHRELRATIADPNDVAGQFQGPQRVMTCHETEAAHCLGWLVNQAGDGNNIALRMKMRTCANAEKIRLRGEQHQTFADTLREEMAS